MESNPAKGQESSERAIEESPVSRREYMAGVASLAAVRWDSEDYDIENADEWEPLKRGIYETGTFVPLAISSNGRGASASWMIEDDQLQERALQVWYDPESVHIAFEGESDETYAGGLAELEPEQAKELGAALYQAAVEYETVDWIGV
jgi:hypothetical protein